MTDYGIGEERADLPSGREWLFLIDGEARGKIQQTGKGFRADVTYTGVPRESLPLAFADGQRQAEAKRGRFTGKGLTVTVTALAETDTKPRRLKVTDGGTSTEVNWNWEYSGSTLGEWAVRQARPLDEPVFVRGIRDGWEFRI